MRVTSILTGVVFLAATSVASASFIEFEPNDTIGTGNSLPYHPGDGTAQSGHDTYDLGFAALSSGDVDTYIFRMGPLRIFQVMTGDAGNPVDPPGPDTIIRLLDCTNAAAPIVLVTNDDAGTDQAGGPGGNSLYSALRYTTPSTPGIRTYCLQVSGFADFGFTGNHSQVGDYSLTLSIISCVPEPGTLGLLALGLLGLIRRR